MEKLERRRRAITYPCASTVAYLRPHQNPKCVPPVLIHWAITCSSSKRLGGVVWQSKKKDPKSYFFTPGDPQSCPRGKIFAPLYFTLHYLWFDMQHDYACIKWILDPLVPQPPPPGPAPRSYIKIQNVFLQSSSRLRAFPCESFEILAAMVCHYRWMYGQMGECITISLPFLWKVQG